MPERKPETKIEARLALRVHPGARRNEIRLVSNDLVDVKVAAPPDKGKANAELLSFLAIALGVARSEVSIVRGEFSHNKLVSVLGLTTEEALARLARLASPTKSEEQRRLPLP